MDVCTVKLFSMPWLMLIFMTSSFIDGSQASSRCAVASQSDITTVEGVEVTYINTTTVNISWTHPTSDIGEYTVFYTPLALLTQDINRTMQNESFTDTHGVITGLDESVGYEFLVVVRNESQCDSLDTRTVHALRDQTQTAGTTASEGMTQVTRVRVNTIVTVVACVLGTFILYTIVLVIVVCCYRRSQKQIKRLKKEVMAVNELDFPNPGTIGDASEYKVSPLYPMDTLSSEHQSSATADIERETVFANKGTSGRSAE